MLIIFDWDGTLQNTIAKIVVCMQKAAREAAIVPPSDEAVRDVIGLSLKTAMDELFGDTFDARERGRLQEIYSRIYKDEDSTATPFFEGAIATLEKLRLEGHTLAVATGKRRQGLARILDEHDLHHHFAATRCADETRSKPDPLMINELLAELNVSSNDAVMIGDSRHDMAMAVNASVGALGITHGVHDATVLRDGGASQTIDFLADLHAALPVYQR